MGSNFYVREKGTEEEMCEVMRSKFRKNATLSESIEVIEMRRSERLYTITVYRRIGCV